MIFSCYVFFAVMVAQDVGVRGGEGLGLSKGNGRENEESQENYDGKDAHGAQYGAEPKYRQGAQRRLERTVLRSGAIWRDDTVSFSCGIAEVLVKSKNGENNEEERSE